MESNENELKKTLKDKLKQNEILTNLLKSDDLRKQLAEVIEKKKEQDIYDLLNNYYGQKIGMKTKDETILKDYILESDQFKQFIIELINVIEE